MKTLLFLAMWWVSVAAAQGAAPVVNGCGSGRLAMFVPNDTIVTACHFEASCNLHDVCYGRCEANGDLVGQATCKDELAKSVRRNACDNALAVNIKLANKGKPACAVYAALYRWAVETFGASKFKGAAGANANIVQLNNFLEYIAKNPEAFDAQLIETSLLSLSALNVKASEQNVYRIEFESFIPKFTIWLNDTKTDRILPVLEISGKGVAQ